MKPVDGKICSLNTRTSTRTLWQPSGKQAFSIAGLYFSVSVSQSWMELWARLDPVLCVTYCSWLCSIFLFVSYFSYNSWFPLSLSLSPLRPAFNLINIHAEIFLFLLLLCDLMVWEADVWRVVRPLQKLLFYSVFSVRALWSLINQTLHINTFIFHQRPLSYRSIVVTVSLVFFVSQSWIRVYSSQLTGFESSVSTFICRNCTILHFTLTWSQLGFDLEVSAGNWVLIKEARLVGNLHLVWLLQPSALSLFSLSLKTVLQFAADPLACLQRQRKRTWRSGRKWAGRR